MKTYYEKSVEAKYRKIKVVEKKRSERIRKAWP